MLPSTMTHMRRRDGSKLQYSEWLQVCLSVPAEAWCNDSLKGSQGEAVLRIQMQRSAMGSAPMRSLPRDGELPQHLAASPASDTASNVQTLIRCRPLIRSCLDLTSAGLDHRD